MTTNDFFIFRDLIDKKSGLHFDEGRKGLLEEALRVRIKETKAGGFQEYYRILSEVSTESEEFSRLLDILTIKETFFLRDKAQFEALRTIVLPEIIHKQKNRERNINIWSAACATGEEPYSIAMFLLDALPNPKKWNIRILATDISDEALTKARKGVYRKRSIRLLSDTDISRFFEKKGEEYVIVPQVKSLVEFSTLNLVRDAFPTSNGNGWDIIFCRNVIIYFQVETIRKVLTKINQSLSEEGFLFTGYAEILRYLSTTFQPVNFGGAFIYKKKKESGEGKGETALLGNNETKSPRKLQPAATRSIPSKLRPQALPISPTISKRETVLPKVSTSEGIPSEQEKKQKAGKCIELAEKLSNQGLHKEAIEECHLAIKHDPLLVDAYFLAGLLYNNKGDTSIAIKKFKKTLFLKPDYFLARLNLADLYLKEGIEQKKIIIEYTNILEGLLQNPKEDLGKFAGGYTAENLLKVCKERLTQMGAELPV